MKILISAAEASSDTHAAELLKALKKLLPSQQRFEAKAPSPLEAFGIGGPALEKEGLRAIVKAEEFLAMGSSEVLGRLPRILKALDTIVECAQKERPEVAIVVDYPDFHFRLAKRLKALGIPVIYYIPPKVWVWRKGRIRDLARLFDRVLGIFPFEQEVYRSTEVEFRYVGNPLLDELPLSLSQLEARQKLGLDSASLRVITLMPGSRPAELKRHLEPMLEAVGRVASRLIQKQTQSESQAPLKVLIPLPEVAKQQEIEKRIELWMQAHPQWRDLISVRVSRGDSWYCLLASDAGLIKSGTSTLEAALLGCPHAVVYQPSPLTGFIFRNFIRYRGPVGLVNLALGWKPGDRSIAQEILMKDVTAPVLAEELFCLLTDADRIERMKNDFSDLRRKLSGAQSPSKNAATEILSFLEGRGQERGKLHKNQQGSLA